MPISFYSGIALRLGGTTPHPAILSSLQSTHLPLWCQIHWANPLNHTPLWKFPLPIVANLQSSNHYPSEGWKHQWTFNWNAISMLFTPHKDLLLRIVLQIIWVQTPLGNDLSGIVMPLLQLPTPPLLKIWSRTGAYVSTQGGMLWNAPHDLFWIHNI